MDQLQNAFIKGNSKIKYQYINYNIHSTEELSLIDKMIKINSLIEKTQDRTDLYVELNLVRQELRKVIKQKSKRSFLEFIIRINDVSSRELYQYANKIDTSKVKVKQLNYQGSITNDTEKMLRIAEQHFKSIFSIPHSTILNINNDESSIDKIWDQNILKKFTDLEVQEVINSCNENTCPGFDGISMIDVKFLMLKKEGDKTIPDQAFITKFTHWVNEEVSIGLGDMRKIAVLIPIHKRNDPNEISNYRPISITPVISRIIMKLLTKRLAEYIQDNSIINPLQFGFMKGKGTIQAIQLIREHIIKADIEEQVITLQGLDISNAYNNVNHRKLLSELSGQIPEEMITFISKWLNNASFKIKIANELGETIPIKRGVPQGDPISPLLFNLYINRILQDYNGKDLIAMFADDIVSISKKRSELNKTNKYIIKNLKELDLEITVDKTDVWSQSFTKKRVKKRKRAVTLKHKKIPISNHFKFLGITFSP